jgi:hypothetical protein
MEVDTAPVVTPINLPRSGWPHIAPMPRMPRLSILGGNHWYVGRDEIAS